MYVLQGLAARLAYKKCPYGPGQVARAGGLAAGESRRVAFWHFDTALQGAGFRKRYVDADHAGSRYAGALHDANA